MLLLAAVAASGLALVLLVWYLAIQVGPAGETAAVAPTPSATLAGGAAQAAQDATPTPLPRPTSTAVRGPTRTPTAAGPVGRSGEWVLRFEDEFEGGSLNREKWVTCFWWDDDGCTIASNNELQWYRPENVSVEGGVLRLEARRQETRSPAGRRFGYTSGMVTTGRPADDLDLAPGFAFQYGYVEVRARIPSGRGLWPAIWLLPASHESRPEIDIMEVLGHDPATVHMTLHYNGPDGERLRSKREWTGPDLSRDWHTYAVDWTPDEITWYIDGEEARNFTRPSQIPAEPMYLLINLAVGGDWPGEPGADTRFPSAFEVDYVRIWSRQEAR